MKKICIWEGTDALTLIKYPPGRLIWHVKLFFYRIKWKIFKKFFDEHWARHERIGKNLSKFGIMVIRIFPSEINISGIERKQHKGINVLYYLPRPANLGGKKFRDWLYGAEIIAKLMKQFPDMDFIRVDGSQNMKEIYPVIDCYIRPTRSDGMPRMIMECEALGIPYKWSESGNPEYENFKFFLLLINKDRYAKKMDC